MNGTIRNLAIKLKQDYVTGVDNGADTQPIYFKQGEVVECLIYDRSVLHTNILTESGWIYQLPHSVYEELRENITEKETNAIDYFPEFGVYVNSR
ncbi:MAG: hypothetical protein AAGA18_09000 [Verrucomicrobiota bacterium]